MSWANIDPKERAVAERVLTKKQLEVVKLKAAGYGHKRMSVVLGVSPDTVRGHLRAAERKLLKALGDELPEAA